MTISSPTRPAEPTSDVTTWTELSPRAPRTPEVSVIVPTFRRAEMARQLIDLLDRQTTPSDHYEVLVVDDGSPEPLLERVRDLTPTCHLAIGYKRNGGPARARNAAIARARGQYLLILNDDAVPALDLIERHLEAQARHDFPVATLGTFDYSERARTSAFVRFLERSGLTFGYPGLEADRLADFWSFWTCNICVEKDHVDAVGGFDDNLPDALMEDVELGWRLQRDVGMCVRYVPEARCVHDHLITVDDYARRQRLLGTNSYRLFRKFENVSMLSLGSRGGQLSFGWLGPFDRRFFLGMENSALRLEPLGRRSIHLLKRWDQISGAAADLEAEVDDEKLKGLEASLTRWCFISAVAEAGLAEHGEP